MTVFVEIGILMLCATIAGVVATRFRVPPVLGLLLIGAIVGPKFFAVVSQSETVTLFSEIGATLLLFTIGVEFSASKLASQGIRTLGIAVAKLAITFFLAFQLAALLGFTGLGALYVAAIVAITSTALMIKIVEQKNFLSKQEVPTLIATLILEDVFAIFALAVFSGMNQGEVGAKSLAYSISFAIIILLAVYFVLLKFLSRIFDYLLKYQASETMTLLALGLGVGFSYLAQALGLTPSVGAFLAGSLVASLPKGNLLEKSIHPFALAFSSIFFLSVGMLIDFSSIEKNVVIIAALVVGTIVFKFIGAYVGTYLFGFSSKQSFFAGLAMLPVGEFSLLIAQEGNSVVGFDLVGFTSATIFFTTLATALWLEKYEGLNATFVKFVPKSVRGYAVNSSFAFSEAVKSIESAGKSTFSAAAQNWRYWIVGGVILLFGVIAESLDVPSKVRVLGFSLTQLSILAASLTFALAVQKSVVSLAARPTKSVERFSRMVSLTAFLLLLPFIASSFAADVGQADIILLMFGGGVTLYILYSTDKERPTEGREKGIVFFKE